MKTVLFVTDLHIGAQIEKISGVFERARRLGWRVVEIERERTGRPLSDFVASWHPAGCIVECSGGVGAPEAGFGGIPMVFLDPGPNFPSSSRHTVTDDARAVASLAADELVAAGCTSFAFVGWRARTGWSAARGGAFRACLAACGRACVSIDAPWGDELELQKRLAGQFARLPRRLGVFAANDYVARQVAAAIDAAGMACPRDVAVVGVDDDELICENAVPTLSSIPIDFKRAGRMAADLLAEAMADPGLKPKHVEYGPLSVTRRQSTRIVNSNDWRIVRAVERIRRDACAGLRAAEVVAETGLSRRLVERRFLAATGRTILEEIAEVRFAHACQLLRDPTLPVGLVGEQCGWESDSYFKRFFKSRTGLSPRQWRKAALE